MSRGTFCARLATGQNSTTHQPRCGFICRRRQALGPLYLANNDVAVDFGRGNELLTEETRASFDEQAALALQVQFLLSLTDNEMSAVKA